MHTGIQKRTETWLGEMRLWVTPAGLAGAWFVDQKHAPDFDRLGNFGSHVWLDQASEWLESYFAGRSQPVSFPLDLSAGTPFQQSVWRALLSIPDGHTTSYSGIASTLGKPTAVRAVGGAIGRNPISIFIPCHRVIGSGGQLTGYAGGVWRKQALLEQEQARAAI